MEANDKHQIPFTESDDGHDKEAQLYPSPPTTFYNRLYRYLPHYHLQIEPDVVQINERPNYYKCVLFGLQHVLAMFSGTVFIPMQLGFDINTALFFSGINTILFFVVTGGKVPAYLGCSGSTVSGILVVTSFVYGHGNLNPNISMVQGAIVVLGLAYCGISLLVFAFGYRWLEWFMPPVVVGSIVGGIGLNLVLGSYRQAVSTPFNVYMALVTVVAIMLISVYAPLPSLRRLCILLGAIIGYIVNLICGIKGAGPPIDFSQVQAAPWVRAPKINTPIEFLPSAISTMVPVVIVFIAENMGHLKALSSITKTPLDHHLGRAYLGDALATTLCGIVGAPPMTTYAENLIILSVTRIYSSLVILFAAMIAIVLGFLTKFGAVVNTIPPGVFGGITFVIYSIIAMTGIRIWMDNKVDFSDTRNIFVGVIPMVLASCMQETLVIGSFQLDGIGCGTFGAIFLNLLLCGGEALKTCLESRRRKKQPMSTQHP